MSNNVRGERQGTYEENDMKTFSRIILAAVLLAAGVVSAQNYPGSRPVRILVGYTPGGGVDTAARMMAQALGEHWGANVLVENRPGAAGNIATEATAKAVPDGYTMVLCNIGSHSITPARFAKRLTYDPIGDFAFSVWIGGVPNIFMVHPSLPFRTLQQYIDLGCHSFCLSGYLHDEEAERFARLVRPLLAERNGARMPALPLA